MTNRDAIIANAICILGMAATSIANWRHAHHGMAIVLLAVGLSNVAAIVIVINRARKAGAAPEERTRFLTREERERWEQYYREAAQRDFERAIYKRCNEEDLADIEAEGR